MLKVPSPVGMKNAPIVMPMMIMILKNQNLGAQTENVNTYNMASCLYIHDILFTIHII